MMKRDIDIFPLSLSHTAPPAVFLNQYGIKGLTKKREFKSEKDILEHYHKDCSKADLTRTTSIPRYTTEPVTFSFVLNGDGQEFTIPAFFTYDGESIGFLQRFNSRGSRIAALVHDWLYYKQLFNKDICDEMMRQIQLHRDVNSIIANTVHFGLRMFGQSSYDAYKDDE